MLDDATIDRARAYDLDACQAVLTAAFPSVYRMAVALSGDAAEGDRVARTVLTRCLKVLPRWRRGLSPENWFYHHTLLATRQAAKAPDAPAAADPLVTILGLEGGSGYAAFVRALRNLPTQQREAYLLNHGERLNPRWLGVAMDCSTAAAENHLAAATAALMAIAGNDGDRYEPQLSRAYLALTPAPELIPPAVRREVLRVVRPMRLRRLIRRVAVAVLIVSVIAAAWAYRDELRALWQRRA